MAFQLQVQVPDLKVDISLILLSSFLMIIIISVVSIIIPLEVAALDTSD